MIVSTALLVRERGARATSLDAVLEHSGAPRGPAGAFAAVKQFAAAYTEGGVAAADERLLKDAVGLFDTEDAHNAIESFLAAGPGKATFAGR
jgi:hypothetical protein